jgi:alpha-methylacyl-CoA racemase
MEMGGPLVGIRVVELAGIGPGPFCAMMLGDLGAEVIRVERYPLVENLATPRARPDALAPDCAPPRDPLLRNRRSVALNLKSADGIGVLLKLVDSAAVLIEGFRPGVAERLGVGPAVCLERNPRLVYGRVTGWGQDGPLAQVAGHDLNYIALSGALHLIGPPGGKPTSPLNLVGDFGGGGMLLLSGVLAALLEASRSGRGQVVDAAMVDGTVALLGMHFALRAESWFHDATGENLLAGAAPFYDTYETRDGKYISVASLEPQFYALLLEKLGLDVAKFGGLGAQTMNDPAARQRWPQLRVALRELFLTRTREQWCQVLEGTDVCFAPVLSLEEAAHHPHNVARKTFIDVDGTVQNAPAPRFSRTPAGSPMGPRSPGEDTEAVLRGIGIGEAEIERLRGLGVLK